MYTKKIILTSMVRQNAESFIIHAQIWKCTKVYHSLVYSGFYLTGCIFAKLITNIANFLVHVIKCLIEPSIFKSHTLRVSVQIRLHHQHIRLCLIPLIQYVPPQWLSFPPRYGRWGNLCTDQRSCPPPKSPHDVATIVRKTLG